MHYPSGFFSNCSPSKLGLRVLSAIFLGFFSTLPSAQMAPMQLTNPAIDAVNGDKTAAWIADENMGVLYCELIAGDSESSKRVVCFDSRGAVAPVRNNVPNH